MKILHIAPGLHPSIGGPTRSIVGICHALAGQGVDVTLFVHCYDPPPDNLAGVRLIHGKGLRLRSVWTDTTRVIRQIQPDIIHLHAFWMPANHLAFSIANRHSTPVVLSIRGSLDPWALRQKWLKKQLALRLYLRGDLRRAACLHATAEQEAANIRAQCDSRPIVVIPNGVDLPEHLPERVPDGRGARTALFLARLHPGKGLLDLVQAWHRVRPRGWRMRIVGPDVCGHKTAVQAEIARLGLDWEFEFAGEVDDRKKWHEYVNADLFVHPSHSENFGISIAEALAAGLPVITTKGAPWSELQGTPTLPHSRTPTLPHSRCGWWIDIGPDALAETLREATSLSDAERRELGANGRQLIAAKYTWHAIGAEMKAAYTSILDSVKR